MNRMLLCVALCICLSMTGIGIVHAQTVLFEDNFSSGNFAKWDVSKDSVSRWTVEKNILGSSAAGKGLAYMSAGDQTWSDYTLKARVKITEGTFEIAFRTGPQGRYYVHYDAAQKQLALRKNKPWDKQTPVSSADAAIPPGQWTTVEISAVNGTIKVSVAGTPAIEYSDKDPLLTGGIQIISVEKSVVSFGDISVTKSAD